MNPKVSFNQLVDVLGSVFEGLPDDRGKNKQYSLSEIGLAAFSVFFTQSRSFLEWQREMRTRKGRSNVQGLFGIEQIASDEQIKNVLDAYPPESLAVVFRYVLRELIKGGVVDEQFACEDRVLVALDGTQYHHSTQVACEQCCCVEKDGKTHYSHTVMLPAVVNPARSEVLVLEPEFVLNKAEAEQQDCESRAAQRWLRNKLPTYALDKVVLLGDDLYSRQPMCEQVLAQGHDFVFVAKPNSHSTLYSYLDLAPVEELTVEQGRGQKKRQLSYRFVNEVPLREGADALRVNWCEIIERDAKGKVCYRNSFVTNLHLTPETVVRIVRWGRGRWKIENEGNNVLKTKGYHFEHNFGHGQRYLSTILLSLLLLAFLFHTVFDLLDARYQAIRDRLGPRRAFFGDIKTLTRFHLFSSWSELLDFMMDGLELEPIPYVDTS